jgi:hypothetical protein
MVVFEFRSHVAGPLGVQEWRSFSRRVSDASDCLAGPIFHSDGLREILGTIPIARHDKGDGFPDKPNSIGREKFRQPVADARIPITDNPGPVIKGEIPSG